MIATLPQLKTKGRQYFLKPVYSNTYSKAVQISHCGLAMTPYLMNRWKMRCKGCPCCCVHCSNVDPLSACSSSEASVASGCWWVAILVGPALSIFQSSRPKHNRPLDKLKLRYLRILIHHCPPLVKIPQRLCRRVVTVDSKVVAMTLLTC